VRAKLAVVPPLAIHRSLFWLGSLLLLSCSSSPEGARNETPAARPNILLLVVDTLRADHLSTYGYARPTSPEIDALAARGVRFDRHRAQAPCTFPSMNSLLTSRPVEAFFGQPQGDMSIPAGVASIAEILRGDGYITAAFSASPIVRKNPSHFNQAGGFERGFQLFDDDCVWKDARCVNERALAALARHQTGEPVFFFLHYIDPHGPYQAPGKGRKRFARRGGRDDLKPEVRAGESHAAAARLDRGEPAGVDAGDVAHWIDLYDDEIAFVDARIGELVAAFERLAPPRGAPERSARPRSTIVALAADHGESFLEHGTLAHCRSLYDTEIRTPWILAGPGIPEGAVREALSENLDIVPTLLDLAGVAVRPDAFAGRSLRAVVATGEDSAPRLQTSAFAGWRAAFDGRHKLMVNEVAGELRLFDLLQDPGERADLAPTERRKAAALRRALAAQSPTRAAALEAARETERQLRALGYL
jgi:arylsulfatase A-like enzyme